MIDFYEKNVLAIDTSSASLQLAIQFGGDRMVKSSEQIEKSHGQLLIKKIGNLLESASLEVGQLDALIVSTGPGSFTGLRIGMAAAKGIAIGLNIPIMPVSMFEICQYKLLPRKRSFTLILPHIKEQYFVALFDGEQIDQNKVKVVHENELSKKVANVLPVAIGFSADSFDQLRSVLPVLELMEYSAAELVHIGIAKLNDGESASLADLEPLYIQKSQAEIRFDARQNK